MRQNLRKRITTTIIITALFFFTFPLPTVMAGELENERDTLTRIKAGTLSSHDINFALSASNTFAAGETITIDFGEDDSKFSVDGASSAIADFDFNDGAERTIVGADGDCTGHSGTNDIAVGVNDTTGVVTFTACASYSPSGSGANIDIEYGTAAGGTDRVTNPSAGNDITIAIGGTNGDSGMLAVSIIADDQVVVTATVNPVFTFAVSSAICALGTLSTGSVSSCNYNITTSTNSEDGYTTTILEDGNLRDGSNDIDDVSDGTVTAGSEEYGIALTGTDRAFADERSITGTAQTIATDTSGPISAQQVTVTHKASVSSVTLAGNYSHTVTLVSTGTF